MTPLSVDQFDQFFREVNEGKNPFPWQSALARRVCENGIWPECLDLPTGSGKTAVLEIAIFHLAMEAERGAARRAPLRIAFVVDRRLIVDQTEIRAHAIQAKLEAEDDTVAAHAGARLRALSSAPTKRKSLVVAKLRGGIPRTSDWAHTPAQPTILLSTVDQVGSRLLFRGYGVSDSMKPVHAGLLGSDCLIFLDEAHLSEPFRQTLVSIARYRQAPWAEKPPGPWQAVTLSATPGGAETQVFRLAADDRAHPILRLRLGAAKPAELLEVSGPVAFAEKAQKLCASGAKRILIVVNRIDLARSIFTALGTCEKILLIGRSRDLDRTAIMTEHAAGLASEAPPRDTPIFVVSTQCIEAGADFDLDALVAQIAPLDALRQRFGRLNRMGRNIEARAAILALKEDLKSKQPDPIYGEQSKLTWALLNAESSLVEQRPTIDFGIDAMSALIDRVGDPKIREVSSNKGNAPVMPPAYLDLWSMTSPRPDPDPDVAIFLHGPETGPADVEIVWRDDLGDVIPARSRYLAEIVGALPPRPSEGLSMPIWKVRAWLTSELAAAAHVGEIEGEGQGDEVRTLTPSRLVLRWCGEDSEDTKAVGAESIRPGDVIIVPSSYGGCDQWGWAPSSNIPVADLATTAAQPFWRQRVAVRFHPHFFPRELVLLASRLHAEVEGLAELKRQLLEIPNLPQTLQAELSAMHRVLEVRDYDSGGFILIGRGSSPSFSTDGGQTGSFGSQALALDTHTAHVKEWITLLAAGAGLPAPVVRSSIVAAELHDLGKGDRRFQSYLRNGAPIEAVLAKSERGYLAPAFERKVREMSGLPDHWRHEALSVRIALANRPWASTADLDPELILWLIGTHHGHGRPFFPFEDPLDDQDRDVFSATGDTIHLLASSGPQRLDFDWNGLDWPSLFNRLKRRYGIWELARFEAVIRLADHRASEYGAHPGVKHED